LYSTIGSSIDKKTDRGDLEFFLLSIEQLGNYERRSIELLKEIQLTMIIIHSPSLWAISDNHVRWIFFFFNPTIHFIPQQPGHILLFLPQQPGDILYDFSFTLINFSSVQIDMTPPTLNLETCLIFHGMLRWRVFSLKIYGPFVRGKPDSKLWVFHIAFPEVTYLSWERLLESLPTWEVVVFPSFTSQNSVVFPYFLPWSIHYFAMLCSISRSRVISSWRV